MIDEFRDDFREEKNIFNERFIPRVGGINFDFKWIFLLNVLTQTK